MFYDLTIEGVTPEESSIACVKVTPRPSRAGGWTYTVLLREELAAEDPVPPRLPSPVAPFRTIALQARADSAPYVRVERKVDLATKFTMGRNDDDAFEYPNALIRKCTLVADQEKLVIEWVVDVSVLTSGDGLPLLQCWGLLPHLGVEPAQQALPFGMVDDNEEIPEAV